MPSLRRIALRLALACTAGVLLVSTAAPALEAQQPALRTWQEENEFKAGPTPFEPLMKFWYELDRQSDLVSIRPLTRTLLGREFTLVTISKEPMANAQDALRSGKTIVFIGNAVHGNEPAGKEASQLVARDLVFGDLRHVLDSAIVLFVPLINPDGGEVRRRTNEEGFDMNRDWLKLESQEIHAIVTQVLNEWTPDIHIDTHHGGSAPYTLTWQGTLNPAADRELREYPYRTVFPAIRTALRAEGYDGFDYSGAQTRDGVRGWGSTSVEARKHHVYTGLVNSIGMLFETPSSTHRVRNGAVEAIPQPERYYHQVRGQVIGIRTVLLHAHRRRSEVRALTNASRLRAIRAGANPTAADAVVVEYELVSRGTEPVWMPNAPAGGPGGGQGGPGGQGQNITYTLQNVPVWLKYDVKRTIPRARGYVLPASIAKVVPLLLEHGIQVHRFTTPTTLELEVYDALGVRRNEYFQGHYLQSVTGVEKKVERVDVPAGWYYVSTAQSKGNLISYFLEPETDDNLITWNYTDNVLRVTPSSVDEAMQGLLGDNDLNSLTPQQREQLEARARAMMAAKQRVPMMRLVTPQPMPLLEVISFNEYNRTRYWQP
ncbi:MAG: succinylglutamate desuccinylase/aspartoacylase family protein [Gemmatimonadaceae bacterium]|nr:succinylglutamate desuccinylase/aspartoacylase family protein [Gemmatimonadaceae bacterium]MCW5825603.1 succinylglutamate desuccinylase/aspartoacylase family protein [Gemmatimonadaceae bacterium]